MPRRFRLALFIIFAITGFSALTLQVVWQRVISMHAGVDLFSITTVVSSFLAGLGIGNLLGGYVADRLEARGSLFAFAGSNALIGGFAWISIWLFYDVYRLLVPYLRGTAAAFAFHFLLLLVPTTLMGLSLPLISRGVVRAVREIGPIVGRLYGVNTIGAAAGAGVSGWWMIGSFGFPATIRIAAALNLLAAALLLTLLPAMGGRTVDVLPRMDSEKRTGSVRVWPWLVIYGLTGAVALGLEVVFFRIIDAVMRSNSYSFAHVLTLYLLLFGAGSAAASVVVRRVREPARWFLWLQWGVGLTAIAGVVLLVRIPRMLGIEDLVHRYFLSDGMATGFSIERRSFLLFANVTAPLLVMAAPIFLAGASFPFIQAHVARNLTTLGRRTGTLLFSNIAGNVAGTLITGFLLLDRLGTINSLQILTGLLLIAGAAAGALATARWRRAILSTGSAAVFLLVLLMLPNNHGLWSFIHSAPPGAMALAEDRACVNALVDRGNFSALHVNGASQNNYPYDDFHLLVGLMPSLMHPQPSTAMAVGLGIGGTAYGIAQDPRIGQVDVVEICSGQFRLARQLAEESPETGRMLSDQRVRLSSGDGRKFLLATNEFFDVVAVDALRPQAAHSGNIYSVEFYELVRLRMRPGGLFAQWIPSERVINSAKQVFPYVFAFSVPYYFNSKFLVASDEPLAFNRESLLLTFDGVARTGSFLPQQAESLRKWLEGTQPELLSDGNPGTTSPEDQLNRDLFPRDEYFLNNR
jgi:spermidine synthase